MSDTYPVVVISTTVSSANEYAKKILQPGWKPFNIHQYREVAMCNADNYIVDPKVGQLSEKMMNALALMMKWYDRGEYRG